jgi:cysteine desulfurase
MQTTMTYLDYNATAPLRPEAAAALAEAAAAIGNPSSVHRFGRDRRRRIENAREQVAALTGAAPGQVVFTSGGTEANQLALRGAFAGPPARTIASAIEHDSVLAAGVTPAPVGADGLIDLAALAALLAKPAGPTVLSLMLANNETGVIQPVAEAASLAQRAGVLVHCDAVQAAGRVPLDMAALGVDLLSLSAHKLGGPPGVGALIVADRVALAAQVVGGGQERGRRAGTENVPGIAAFGAAAVAAAGELDQVGRLAQWRDRLEREALAGRSDAVVFGAAGPRLPNTSCLGLPGLSSETQVMALDLAGVAVSAGAACSSGKLRPSHVLRAMGASAAVAGSAIRVSLGWATEAADIDRFLAAWLAMAERARPLARRQPAA